MGAARLAGSLVRYANLHGSAHPDWRRGSGEKPATKGVIAMTNQLHIQLKPKGSMWRVYVNGVCRAFCANFLDAEHRADQLLAQLQAQVQRKLGGEA